MAEKKSDIEATAPSMPSGPPTREVAERARAAARQAAAQRSLQPGTVLNLPAGWTPYVIDKSHDPGRLSTLRAKLETKGYTKFDGLAVAGISAPEVWAIPTEVYDEFVRRPREERDDKARRLWKQKQINV